jgi:hypothetical protein
MASTLWLLVLLCSCGSALAPNVQRVRADAYIFGLFGSRAIDLRDVCAGGAANQARITRQGWMYLASLLTLGIYVPHQVEIRCRRADAS